MINQDYPSKNELTSQLYHLNLQYDFGAFSVRSVSGYQHMNSILQEDSSRSSIAHPERQQDCDLPLVFGTPTCYDDVAGWNTSLNSYTEEFDIISRPGKLEWIAGAFLLLAEHSRQFVAEFEGGDTPNPDVSIPGNIEDPGGQPSNLAYGNDSRVSRHSYSGFIQATYHFLPNLRLTLGGRYNTDSYRDVSFNFSKFGTSTVDHTQNDVVPTWRAEIDYDATSDNLLYVSAARGYKPGGVNGSNGQIVIPVSFLPETNTALRDRLEELLL